MKRKRGKRSESKRKLREKDTTRPCLPPGSKSQLFSCGNSWHLYFHDPDNVCLNMERLQKVKGRGSMVDVRLVIATSELSLIPERPGISVFMWWQRVPHQHTHKGFFIKTWPLCWFRGGQARSGLIACTPTFCLVFSQPLWLHRGLGHHKQPPLHTQLSKYKSLCFLM